MEKNIDIRIIRATGFTIMGMLHHIGPG